MAKKDKKKANKTKPSAADSKQKPKKSAVSAAAQAAPEPASKPEVVLAHFEAKYALPKIEREAFESLATDEDRARLGALTKAANVAACAAAWAVSIDDQLNRYPVALEEY